MSATRKRRWRGLTALCAAAVLTGLGATTARATVPAGFQETAVFSGLTSPTALRFASDGRIFVAQKNGQIKVYDSLSDTTPTLFADLGANVHDYWDRGLLGMALDPNFPATPYVYVLYTYDAPIGGSPPTWGDGCPNPPGATTDGCVVSARLSRLTASGNTMTGAEQVLINDWCQQFPSHSIGALNFGPDGALYVTGGDGASFNYADYGQTKNPCGDPPGPAGTNLTAPTAEGGALRSQDVRTTADPAGLDGTVLRVSPSTGDGVAGNPFQASTDANARRIIAYGLRNPFRATFRPGTGELWVGDVGWNTWEEVNRITTTSSATNFGWPCYEGAGRQSGYDSLNVNICENLYAAGTAAVTAPVLAYNHSSAVVSGDGCPTANGSAVAGLAFASAQSTYPAAYDGALFFADHNRNCIWAMLKGADGLPSPASTQLFMAGGSGPVDLQIGPGGDLFYAGYDGGDIRRISYPVANHPPVAVATATPTSGDAPLTVAFDGRGSSDADGDTLTYAWDLDGDGAYDDSTSATPSWTYTQQGAVTAALRVDDGHGATATDTVTITVGNTKPTATIEQPLPGTTYRVGQTISFKGSATDAQDGTLPAAALTWQLIQHHCNSDGCHEHAVQSWVGVSSGSFSAPDHEYPSYLELRLTATDSGGLSDTQSLRLDPRTVQLTFASSPGGMTLGFNSESAAASFTRTVIEGSSNSIAAPDQVKNRTSYVFQKWSDGGARAHNITANTTATYTATFKRAR